MGAGTVRQLDGGVDAGAFAGSRRAPVSSADWDVGAFVRSKRACGVSWSAVARMVERSEHDVRLAFDPDYDPPAMLMRARSVVEAATPKVAEPVSRMPPGGTPRAPPEPGLKAGTLEARAVALVADGAGSAARIAEAMGRRLEPTQVLMQTLRRKGLVDRAPKPIWWKITTAGLKALMVLDGEAVIVPAGAGVWADGE